MGYPRLGLKEAREFEFNGFIRFRGFDSAVKAKPVRLKVPPQTQAGKATVTGDDQPPATGPPGQWVNSDNGDLSIRLSIKSPRIAAQENVSVIAQIRNNRTSPVTILRPFGDRYDGESVYLKIWGKDGRIKYTGPEFDYVLDAKAFVTLGPGETATDTLELSNENFAGLDQAGTYTLRYDYRYEGAWDETVAREGVKDVWRGWMCSREVSLVKE